MKPTVTDFTKDGKCSRCGACCNSMLPLTDAEVKAIADVVRNRGLKPPKPKQDTEVNMRCPFLMEPNVLSPMHACMIYDERPALCRSFLCSRSRQENLASYMATTPEIPGREPTNMWSFFGLTGIRFDGHDIPWESECPEVTAWDDEGRCWCFKTGRHVEVVTKKHRTVKGMVLVIEKQRMAITDDETRRSVWVDYKDIREVNSKSCLVVPAPPVAGTKA